MITASDIEKWATDEAGKYGCELVRFDGQRVFISSVCDGFSLSLVAYGPHGPYYGALAIDVQVARSNAAEHWVRLEVSSLARTVRSGAMLPAHIPILELRAICPVHGHDARIESVDWEAWRFGCSVEGDHRIPESVARWHLGQHVIERRQESKEKP